MKYPDMMEHAMNGVKLASQIAALPKEAQQNAAQVAMTSIVKEKANADQKRLKAIQAAPLWDGQGDRPPGALTQQEKDDQHDAITFQYKGGTAGTESAPYEAQIRGQQVQQGQQNLQIQRAQNPGLYPNKPANAPVQQPKKPAQQPPAEQPTKPQEQEKKKSFTDELGYLNIPAAGTGLAYAGSPSPASFLQQPSGSEWWNQIAGGLPLAPMAPIDNYPQYG
jgi:hypothetical protein